MKTRLTQLILYCLLCTSTPSFAMEAPSKENQGLFANVPLDVQVMIATLVGAAGRIALTETSRGLRSVVQLVWNRGLAVNDALAHVGNTPRAR